MVIQEMLNSVNSVLNLLLPLLLNVTYALALLLIGWIIAKVLQWVVAYVLKTLQLDKGCQTIGLTPLLTKGEIKKAPSDLLGDLIYWLTIIVAVVATADFLGLRGAMKLFKGLLGYLPSVVSAAVVLGAAMLLAAIISGLVLLIANNIGLSYSKTLARVINYALIIFGFVVAIGILGISAKLIVASFSVVVGAVGLAVAIAFGLGCKDIAGDFITNLFKQR